MKILMVCLGNICRSPMAEGILKHKAKQAGLAWTIESAGTNGFHIGQEPHHLSQKVASSKGIDICDQRSKQFNAADFQKFDKIYALASDVIDEMKYIAGKYFEESKVDLLMNELEPGKNLDVPDPWSGPERGYHHAYQLIESACDKVIERYSNQNVEQVKVNRNTIAE